MQMITHFHTTIKQQQNAETTLREETIWCFNTLTERVIEYLPPFYVILQDIFVESDFYFYEEQYLKEHENCLKGYLILDSIDLSEINGTTLHKEIFLTEDGKLMKFHTIYDYPTDGNLSYFRMKRIIASDQSINEKEMVKIVEQILYYLKIKEPPCQDVQTFPK